MSFYHYLSSVPPHIVLSWCDCQELADVLGITMDVKYIRPAHCYVAPDLSATNPAFIAGQKRSSHKRGCDLASVPVYLLSKNRVPVSHPQRQPRGHTTPTRSRRSRHCGEWSADTVSLDEVPITNHLKKDRFMDLIRTGRSVSTHRATIRKPVHPVAPAIEVPDFSNAPCVKPHVASRASYTLQEPAEALDKGIGSKTTQETDNPCLYKGAWGPRKQGVGEGLAEKVGKGLAKD